MGEKMSEQLDLFDARLAGERFELPVSPALLREEERFGKWDARTGLTLRNHYSSRIFGKRLAAYERAFREERASAAVASLEEARRRK
jgi:hypothetical protein